MQGFYKELQRNNIQPFLLIAFTTLLVWLLSFAVPAFQNGFVSIKSFDLFSDLKIKHTKEPVHLPVNSSSGTPAITEVQKGPDSALYAVSEKEIVDFACKDSVRALEFFFRSLQDTKQKGSKTRIAYFGDSMIEGDLVTQDLRNALQQVFGGAGVGFVPITSPTAGFRQTVAHSFSDNWYEYTINKTDSVLLHKPGITGHVFIPQKLTADSVNRQFSWVKYAGSRHYKRLSQLGEVKLYFGLSTAQNAVFTEYKGSFKKQELNGNNIVNELVLNDKSTLQEVKLNFNVKYNLPVYGVSFESDSGVILDNFAFRGNSGLGLTNIPSKIMKGLNNYLDYKLVILHYGINVSNPKMTDYSWYEAGMTRVINYMKTCFPNASILLISVSDKSYKEGTGFVTEPSIPLLVEAQKRVAQKNKVAFWNLYEAMGGYNTMVKWVEGDTVLANKDYTHLNFKGARKVAALLNKYLMQEYVNYCSRPQSTLSRNSRGKP